MIKIEPQEWKKDLQEFRDKTDLFYSGELDKKEYKGFSGGYGSYAQRGGNASMLRLRLSGGQITKEKLGFIVRSIKKHGVNKVHFTTCQTIQLHNLQKEAVYDIMEEALSYGIVTRGGGGDFPRNVMVSPLSGVEQGEYFDVLPYAKAVGEYLMTLIKDKKMPRKLKVGFSNAPTNLTHATFRDLGFIAREDGTFDVYSAGGLGMNPKIGVKVAEAVEPALILYYVRAMWETFLTYGNYENRAKARTRYMQDSLGGPEEYAKAYAEKLKGVFESDQKLALEFEKTEVQKTGEGSISGRWVIPQKQEGLYAVKYHPVGGSPAPEKLEEIYETIKDMDQVELRLSPDESVYIINLTASEAEKVEEILSDNAKTLFETSVACIGASICQVGVRDSQAVIKECIDAVREAGIKDGCLPQIHISGCPSSCGTHQTGAIGFHGGVKMIDKVPNPAFTLHLFGNDHQGQERFGETLGVILQKDIPVFLVELGRCVMADEMSYEQWEETHREEIKKIASGYLV